jgi:hypothetical protein
MAAVTAYLYPVCAECLSASAELAEERLSEEHDHACAVCGPPKRAGFAVGARAVSKIFKEYEARLRRTPEIGAGMTRRA